MPTGSANTCCGHVRPLLHGQGRVGEDRHQLRARRARPPRCRGRAATSRSSRRGSRSRRRPRRSAGGGAVALRHQPPRSAVPVRGLGEELARRGAAGGRRSSISPTTRLAAWSARSATSARSSPIARCFSDSMSAVARVRSRSSSSRVAARSRSRDSSATFWARARMSFASRRASWIAARRSASAVLAVLARLLGVAQSLLDPLLALGQHPLDGLEGERPDDRQEDHEVGRAR